MCLAKLWELFDFGKSRHLTESFVFCKTVLYPNKSSPEYSVYESIRRSSIEEMNHSLRSSFPILQRAAVRTNQITTCKKFFFMYFIRLVEGRMEEDIYMLYFAVG